MRQWFLAFVACVVLVAAPRVGLAFAPAPSASAPPASTSTPAAPTSSAAPTAGTPSKPASATSSTAAPASKPAAGKPAGTASTSGPDPFADGGTPDVRQSEAYGERLDGLQAEVDVLKDKIFRSKARLTLLKETVLRGVLAGSRVILSHRNLMGSGFKLVRIVYILDGAQIFARTDETGSLDAEDELVIYDGNIAPGSHEVSIELKYKGHGYGVFSYLTTLTFDSDGTYGFNAPEGGAVKLLSVGFENGNLTTEMKDRPGLSWQEVPLDPSGRPLPKKRARK